VDEENLDHACVFNEDDPMKDALLKVGGRAIWKPYFVRTAPAKAWLKHLFNVFNPMIREATKERVIHHNRRSHRGLQEFGNIYLGFSTNDLAITFSSAPNIPNLLNAPHHERIQKSSDTEASTSIKSL